MSELANYTLYIQAEFHVGSGVGHPGLIDEKVVRDKDGFAIIPGSQIKGLTRQSCAELVQYRGQEKTLCAGQRKWHRLGEFRGSQPEPQHSDYCHGEGDKVCLICALFGSPIQPASLWFSDARYEQEYQNAVGQVRTRIAERDGRSSAHAAIDPLTRRAADRNLFNLEVVQPVTSFSGHVAHIGGQTAINFPDEGEIVEWLAASLLFTRRIGGRRRRGWGSCRFVLAADATQAVGQWLEVNQ